MLITARKCAGHPIHPEAFVIDPKDDDGLEPTWLRRFTADARPQPPAHRPGFGRPAPRIGRHAVRKTRRLLAEIYGVPDSLLDDVLRVRLEDLDR
jgi:hypothetical protein